MKFSDFVVWLSHTSYIEWAKTAVEALKAVAWPLTALFAIRLFKEDLRRLASKLRLFEGFGLKMDFGKEVLEVLAIANELSSNSSGRRPRFAATSTPAGTAVRGQP